MLLLGEGDAGVFGAKRPDVQKNTDCRAARRIEKDVCRRAIRRVGDGRFGKLGVLCAFPLARGDPRQVSAVREGC